MVAAQVAAFSEEADHLVGKTDQPNPWTLDSSIMFHRMFWDV